MIWRLLIGGLWKPLVAVVLLVASWFGGRKRQQDVTNARQAERNLAAAIRAEEIENEVEALRPDDLKSRSRIWVRAPRR